MRRNSLLLFHLLVLCLLPLSAAGQSAALSVPQLSTNAKAVAGHRLSTQAVVHTPVNNSKILILDGTQEGLPQPGVQLRAIMDTLQKNDFSINNLFVEHLDLSRYPALEHRANLGQLLRHKHAREHIGLIICINQQSFEFMATDLKDLVPDAPALLVNVQKDYVAMDRNKRKLIELFSPTDVAGTLRYATTLFPKKRRLVVINGRDDRIVPFMDATAEAIDSLPTKLDVEYTGSLSYEEMLQRIATLPPDTIAFLGVYFNDRTGREFVPAEVAAVVAKTANVPVFAEVDALIRQGLVGGSTVLTDMTGRRTAEIAIDYLHGNITLTQEKTRFEMVNVPLFNWQALDRWKINACSLPANAILINRSPTLWGQYKAAVISAMVVIIILIVFIFALILQNRRRQRAEQMARESEKRFRVLIEQAPEAIVVYDADHNRFVDANAAAEKLLGCSRTELLQTGAQRFYQAEQADQRGLGKTFSEYTARALAGDVPQFEWTIHRADGRDRFCEIHLVRLPAESGKLIRTSLIDITDRKRTEEDRLQLAAAIEQTGEMVVMTDKEGMIQYVNPAFEHITGYRREEAVGKNPRILKSGQQNNDFYQELWGTLAAGRTWKGHFVNKKKDGGFFEEDATISPVKNLSGEISHFVAVKRDVTEQLKTEKQLFQAQKMEAIGTMAGGIAHDFNNILGAISGYTEISLEKIPADSRIKHYLEQIHRSCQRAINLVRQILEFSRLTEKERRPVSLTPLIKETFKMLREIIPTTIDMRLNTRTDADRICGDATQIYQILMNLCTNAYQAMKDKGGLLAVELAGIVVGEDPAGPLPGLNPGSYLELTVRDTGEGIDPLVRERIFDPFFTTKKIGEGTGLGLSVVHGIVSSYGGKITVESRIGAGSAFHVYLPLLVEKPEAPAGEPEQPDRDGRGRILLVDDEPMLADVTREMLENRGYTVVSRTGSLEAWETFRAAPDQFDLVITDQTMPEMTGIDLAENVISIRPGMPVILCTGFIDAAIEEKTTKIGIGAIVLKPVSMKRLISLIRNLLAPVR